MKFQSTPFLWTTLLAILSLSLSLSSVSAIPVAGEYEASLSEPNANGNIETRGLSDGKLQIPTDIEVEETNTDGTKKRQALNKDPDGCSIKYDIEPNLFKHESMGQQPYQCGPLPLLRELRLMDAHRWAAPEALYNTSGFNSLFQHLRSLDMSCVRSFQSSVVVSKLPVGNPLTVELFKIFSGVSECTFGYCSVNENVFYSCLRSETLSRYSSF
ncbi:hypothetical protein BGZ51_004362 [Haplosporangium sp. Z 767]|nr:hypothetical protein BGZ51_004362 [Haplosporangium sp. Z 767]